MQKLLHHLREELIRNRVAKEHLEESLRSEILFLKDQISAEQSEKESLEISYNTEISELKYVLFSQVFMFFLVEWCSLIFSWICTVMNMIGLFDTKNF